jgi:NAD-dependent deacetylase
MKKKKLVILSGAGISAESGIPTFRDANGLWEGHDVQDVASPEGWNRNRELVLEFYNQRRKNASEVAPNRGHEILVELEEHFEIAIITQNIDNLHERAGSTRVLHLHGEIFKSRSSVDPNLVYDMDGWELKVGDKCEKGSQLRPHIVWFGEAVPMIEPAVEMMGLADIVIVVGTSMVVYPAAGLVNYAPAGTPTFVIDPKMPQIEGVSNLHQIEEVGSIGLQIAKERLLKEFVN